MKNWQLKSKFFWCNITAYRKMTYIAIIEIMVLMRYFGICYAILVMTLFFGKLLYNMLITMEWLKQYWKQYCYSQRNTYYELLSFHSLQRYKKHVSEMNTIGKRFWGTKLQRSKVFLLFHADSTDLGKSKPI